MGQQWKSSRDGGLCCHRQVTPISESKVVCMDCGATVKKKFALGATTDHENVAEEELVGAPA
ncbi:MAG: hypothetical protein UV64_C0013G0011 [Parcubacteria group bacterium GW2011_GWC1_43_11b]|nr:MAG: hypothetical protein UV64_C0013G0011 [Parcubacteria group bacterium GW2011_GWC1_43_11b]